MIKPQLSIVVNLQNDLKGLLLAYGPCGSSLFPRGDLVIAYFQEA
jgi:hypothetical protein